MTNLPVVKATQELNAVLILTSGEYFFGKGIGKQGQTRGELCFNTSITGYQEILTDPSYTDQIITFTAPHIGNVGSNLDDNESIQKFAQGLVVREDITLASNFRAEENFNDWLIKNNLTGIAGVDTRAITTLLRENGAVNAIITYALEGEELNVLELLTEAKQIKSFAGIELSSKVSVKKLAEHTELTYQYLAPEKALEDLHIVVLDYGVKHNILNYFLTHGCKISLVNCKASAAEIMALKPDGLFLSNGPGDPSANAKYTVAVIQEILAAKLPIFGICMGHQLLSLAAGLKTFKMHQGHRGANHPVINLATKKVEITAQNHGFCVSDENLPANIEITHRSLFDQTVEGLKLTDRPAFSVQYHPESSSGPHDSKYLFAEFIDLIKSHNKKVARG